MQPQSAYDKTPLRQITGNTLRPGGLALTGQGLQLCAFAPGSRVLDLGCGPGATLSLLKKKGLTPIGLDHSPVLLNEARAHGVCIQADAARLPIIHSSLDGVICECVISLLDDKPGVFQELSRVLRKGGRMLFSDLFLRQPLPLDSPFACARGATTREALSDYISDAGFSFLHIEDHTKHLRELAARIVWQFGSMAAFAELWHTGLPGSNPGLSCMHSGSGNLGYILFIAEKTGD